MLQLSVEGSNPLARIPIVFMANMHGNEVKIFDLFKNSTDYVNKVVGREVLLSLIREVLCTHEVLGIHNIIENTELWVIPAVNPDGYEDAKDSEGECAGT